ncbi:GyrI-like domain-containing protein [Gottfriedia acidiceleris]|uniref:GyrI-like domain-containing protein n=1 Tax=Gottfriedia acidiceleris TaxID=371036 RepID=A0ABY4JIW7_9BACI|nr:GyrI-like domain-containing protein [Gottfriedia acidiceleris]UPM52778.1 GyrI-like domain-containing protein [Gottfriedia acidiceleris]
MSKLEWRKSLKEIYLPKSKPSKIKIPTFKYITIEGKGNPNNELFKENVEALYSLAYAIKMLPKKGIVPEGYFDYTVFPLEGVWDLDEEGRKLDYLNKEHFLYKLMIRQPDFVTEDLTYIILDQLKQKKKNPLLANVKLESITEGLCVQAMHIGSYDDEPRTFKLMEEFCMVNHLQRVQKTHKEIYISDARKTQPEKLKTVLRFQVEER